MPLNDLFDTLRMYDALARVVYHSLAIIGLVTWIGALAYWTGKVFRLLQRPDTK